MNEYSRIIENLKGRKNYEEKKASKLGFASLYDYFEDKISKKQKAIEDEQKGVEKILENMKTEINRDMKLMGCKNIRELNSSKIIYRK